MNHNLSLSVLFALFALSVAAEGLSVKTDFPGGNAEVIAIDAGTQTLTIKPKKIADRGWDCWWYFKLEGITPGTELTLEVIGAGFAIPNQAVYSLDNKTWKQTAKGQRGNSKQVYRLKIDAAEAWFAWGPPFTLAHAQALVAETAKAGPFVTVGELCKSNEGRSVPLLRVTECTDAQRIGIWVHARQHAWEAGASWVCKGFIDWIVSNDPRAQALRRKALITLVPIMDVDNVERGAGGKGQKPNDHNRDWGDTPHFAEVCAAQAAIKAQNDAGAFDVFVDLHNPGPGDLSPYFYTSPKEDMKEPAFRNMRTFLAAARTEMTGPLRFKGETRESGASYDKDWKKISKNWITFNCAPHVIATTLETSWNTPESTIENYERVGKEFGLALELYFREDVRK